jgi:hypothetical protein
MSVSLNTIKQYVSPNTQAAERDVQSQLKTLGNDPDPQKVRSLNTDVFRASSLSNLESTLVQTNFQQLSQIIEKMA